MRHFFVITIAGLLLSGCSSQEKKIEKAAEGYLDAIANYRFDDADKYASTQTKQKTLSFYKYLLPHVDTAYIKRATPATITIKGVAMTSDTTAYALFHKESPINIQDDTIRLIKEKQNWVVKDIIEAPEYIKGDKKKSLKEQYTRRELYKLLKPAGQTLPSPKTYDSSIIMQSHR